jgi:hypothetical protein
MVRGRTEGDHDGGGVTRAGLGHFASSAALRTMSEMPSAPASVSVAGATTGRPLAVATHDVAPLLPVPPQPTPPTSDGLPSVRSVGFVEGSDGEGDEGDGEGDGEDGRASGAGSGSGSGSDGEVVVDTLGGGEEMGVGRKKGVEELRVRWQEAESPTRTELRRADESALGGVAEGWSLAKWSLDANAASQSAREAAVAASNVAGRERSRICLRSPFNASELLGPAFASTFCGTAGRKGPVLAIATGIVRTRALLDGSQGGGRLGGGGEEREGEGLGKSGSFRLAAVATAISVAVVWDDTVTVGAMTPSGPGSAFPSAAETMTALRETLLATLASAAVGLDHRHHAKEARTRRGGRVVALLHAASSSPELVSELTELVEARRSLPAHAAVSRERTIEAAPDVTTSSLGSGIGAMSASDGSLQPVLLSSSTSSTGSAPGTSAADVAGTTVAGTTVAPRLGRLVRATTDRIGRIPSDELVGSGAGVGGASGVVGAGLASSQSTPATSDADPLPLEALLSLSTPSPLQVSLGLHLYPRSPAPAAGGRLRPNRTSLSMSLGGDGEVWDALESTAQRRAHPMVASSGAAGASDHTGRGEHTGHNRADDDTTLCMTVLGPVAIDSAVEDAGGAPAGAHGAAGVGGGGVGATEISFPPMEGERSASDASASTTPSSASSSVDTTAGTGPASSGDMRIRVARLVGERTGKTVLFDAGDTSVELLPPERIGLASPPSFSPSSSGANPASPPFSPSLPPSAAGGSIVAAAALQLAATAGARAAAHGVASSKLARSHTYNAAMFDRTARSASIVRVVAGAAYDPRLEHEPCRSIFFDSLHEQLTYTTRKLRGKVA